MALPIKVLGKLYNLYRLRAGPAPAGEPGFSQSRVFGPTPRSNAITPYLGLRSRLSQVWINRWTVLLFLVLVRTLLAIASIQDGLSDAKAQALSSCSAVESVGSAMASAPHYMAQGVNQLTAHGVEKAINGLWDMLMLTVTGVEEMVVFVINLLTSTYVCLITLVISGSLHVALSLIEDVSNFLNQTLGDIGRDIHTGIDDFESDMNKVVSGLNKGLSVFGGNTQLPTLNIPNDSLNKLDNLQLPSGLDADLQKLNSSIPNFAQVNNFTNNVIRFPFEEIKKLLNSTHGNYTFDRNAFPVPQKETLTFCSDNGGINDFFQGLIDIEVTARKVAIAVLVILAILVCFPMGYREIRRWRMMEDRARLASQRAFDTLDVIYIGSRPYTSLAGIKVAEVSRSYRRQTVIRWMVAYATSEPALFVLSLGIAGLFSCLCHYLVLEAVVKEAPKLAAQVGEFADKVADAMQNASVQWANGTNGVILGMNDRINHDIFGWVETATQAMNNTLNTFSDDMTSALNMTFGGTVLYDPVTEVFNCLIGLKIQGIEKGLTWVHDHAHVDFPLLPNDTLSMQGLASDSGNAQLQSAIDDPNNSSTSGIASALGSLVRKVEDHIRTETIISGCLLAVWLLLVLGGVFRGLMLIFGKRDVAADEDFSYRGGFAREVGSKQMNEKVVVDSDSERSVGVAAPVNEPGYGTAAPAPVPPPPPAGVRTDNTGSRLNGQDYTLKPRPFPSFDSDEKVGSVGGGVVAGSTIEGGNRKSMAARKSGLPPGHNTTFDGLGV